MDGFYYLLLRTPSRVKKGEENNVSRRKIQKLGHESFPEL